MEKETFHILIWQIYRNKNKDKTKKKNGTDFMN